MEAHGGYTFCGLAALVILKQEDSLNLKCLLVSGLCRGRALLALGEAGTTQPRRALFADTTLWRPLLHSSQCGWGAPCSSLG